MISKIIGEEKIQKTHKYIEKGDSFVIVSHVSPDGDSLGSSLALYHFLTKYGKDNVSVIVPNLYPSFFNWMPGRKEIIVHEKYPEFAEQLIRDADVIFCLDFNEPKRLEGMASAVLAAEGRKVRIDHHLDPADFCRVVISHPEISSTSEMIFRLICRMGLFNLIDKNTAECIYTGMMTDTGAFTYNSNKPEIYTIVGELIKKGIEKDLIYRKVNHAYSESRLRLMGYVLNEKMKIYPELHTALITLSKEELKRFDYRPGDTEGLVNMPLSISGIVFSVFLREDGDCIKVSLRSIGNFPVNEFSGKYFNGGGHLNASGGEYYGLLEDAVALFEKGLAEFNPDNNEETVNHKRDLT
ncbi:MAG: bifunctional oligoribonuclease/PAP phosphatase NrnA [Tannerellaceae bacterium]|jgi:phosphoesterase RecJ-like protein|nr:bifunctional oligoribonuclease/PAP phosphatase NrnA [Tannerellaceae bacterium]